jgi:hypothetical protein
MAAPRHIQPADVQGTPLARLLIAHPDVAGAVFAHLDYADATPLRAACRGFRGAVAEHPWALPVTADGTDATNAVRSPAGLARWRAAFPAGRTLVLRRGYNTTADLCDADVAPAAGWGLTGVDMASVRSLTRAGLASLCGPALTALRLWETPELSAADVAAATAASPRLRTLHLLYIGPLADADLAAWGGVHSLTVTTPRDGGGFTGDGVRHLTSVRELDLPLPLQAGVAWVGDAFGGLAHLANLPPLPLQAGVAWVGDAFGGLAHLANLPPLPLQAGVPRVDDAFRWLAHPTSQSPLPVQAGVAWAGDAFRGLAHLTSLSLDVMGAVRGPAGLWAPGSLPRSLRRVRLLGLRLGWPLGAAPDGGAALLRPLAGVADVSLTDVNGVDDRGLCELASATRLKLERCHDVAGERLAPLGAALQELAVEQCDRFTGRGLGSFGALRTLTVHRCSEFQPDALGAVAAGCPALERVDVAWEVGSYTHRSWRLGGGMEGPPFNPAAAEAALLGAASGGGGGEWAFTRSDGAWGAVRRPLLPPQEPPSAPAPAAAAAAGATAGSAGDVAGAAAAAAAATASPDGSEPPPARRRRLGELE